MSRNLRARVERLYREFNNRTGADLGEIVVELLPTHDEAGRLLPPVSEVVVTEGDEATPTPSP